MIVSPVHTHIICVILEAAQKKREKQTIVMMSVCQEAHAQIQIVPADKVFSPLFQGYLCAFLASALQVELDLGGRGEV